MEEPTPSEIAALVDAYFGGRGNENTAVRRDRNRTRGGGSLYYVRPWSHSAPIPAGNRATASAPGPADASGAGMARRAKALAMLDNLRAA